MSAAGCVSAADVVVLGSANVDLTLSVATLPQPGETVLASGAARACGGKGANQAIAAARAGARTCLLGAVGADAEGELLRANLSAAGVAVDALRSVEATTGMAAVVVDERGENSVIVVAGANGELVDLVPAELARARRARVLLGQLETPASAFIQAARAAREHGARVLLNATPCDRACDAELWPLVDVLIVNEHEAAELGGHPGCAAERGDPPAIDAERGRPPAVAQAFERLLERVPCVVVTLGAAGAMVADRQGLRASVAAPPARVVDTTGAGDTFCGVLAARLALDVDIVEAIADANAAGSLAVERPGAAPSIPSAADIAARRRGER